ncbi:class F sortase [Microbacterium resistens]|uniref:Class F sortase n=1 Tax=Microbacterium resistens TaxID=156977 RepID=A0ABY3RWX8_9MICO|nr:class F sortase [Microbacterium resistens]UGS28377.1 class F sortase [Microbacterium resistens]
MTTGLDEAGDFEIPAPERAGVFTGSAPLNADRGSTLIAGHVVDRAGALAPMAQLALLGAGDVVSTADETGQRRDWVVVASEVVPRDGLRPEMWQQDGDRRLVLITCAGRLDDSTGAVEFVDNLVVTAVPAG